MSVKKAVVKTTDLMVSTVIIIECTDKDVAFVFMRQVAKYGAKPDLVSLYSRAAVKAFEPSGTTTGEVSYETSLAQVCILNSTQDHICDAWYFNMSSTKMRRLLLPNPNPDSKGTILLWHFEVRYII